MESASLLLMYKVASIISGTFICWMGYKLYERGIYGDTGNVSASASAMKIVLKKAAPGTAFLTLGVSVLWVSIGKGFDVQGPADGSGKSESATVRVSGLGGGDSRIPMELNFAKAVTTVGELSKELPLPESKKALWMVAYSTLTDYRLFLAGRHYSQEKIDTYFRMKNSGGGMPDKALDEWFQTGIKGFP